MITFTSGELEEFERLMKGVVYIIIFCYNNY